MGSVYHLFTLSDINIIMHTTDITQAVNVVHVINCCFYFLQHKEHITLFQVIFLRSYSYICDLGFHLANVSPFVL